ncbi:MAG: Tetratricopeptide repeat [Clostridiales bacterium]|jgi:molecular chaperone GrpE (heat shock protein)|nr:Tetratricopeptide repeat [Clostridiales bacterium]MDN5283493.1 Tetratricopeptide repeat [Candidatus Ozemobacter sp.]
MNPDGNGEISNEFFKKLNQQIVQKDNLIKLLQLQIRNLKNQIEAGGAGAEDAAELKKALEDKSLEVEKIQAELAEQKSQFDSFSKEKEEQIQALSKLLEEQQAGGEAATEVLEDPRVPELEAKIESLNQELEKALAGGNPNLAGEIAIKDKQIEQLQQELAETQKTLAVPQADNEQLQQLQMAAEATKAELDQATIAIEQLSQQLQDKDAEIESLKSASAQPADDSATNRILELEQDVETLRNLLAEKDEALSAGSQAEGGANPQTEAMLKDAQAEIEVLKSRISDLQNNPSVPASVEDELSRLREENAQISELKQKIEKMQTDADSMAETAMKLTALESEREQLAFELEKYKEQGEAQQGESEVEQSLKLEIAKLKEELEKRDEEISRLRVNLESRDDESMADPAIREEVEQLTGQVADQLLAIQNFEGMLDKAKEQIEEKNLEIEALRAKLAQAPTGESVIPVLGDSEVISSFIDFFDGLDSMLARNPLPELQALHQKLLDRLIIPNQINYVPVISEEFDPDRHIATDYFRSDIFPEKCVVFEVEKGYAKGDSIIKKPKVWVVQNLFRCGECQAMQSNPDSRFCHMCGAKIVAPNGLPVDSLPEFEPTPATYQRFAERMIIKGDMEKAKEYLQSGLELDPNFVPLLVKLGDILGSESKFEEALELLKKANNLKQDSKIQEKIAALEVKLNIFKQAQSLKLDPEEFSKLVNLIQK